MAPSVGGGQHDRGGRSHVVLDIGVDAGGPERYVPNLYVDNADLQWLARLGVDLAISVYPVWGNDDDDDDTQAAPGAQRDVTG